MIGALIHFFIVRIWVISKRFFVKEKLSLIEFIFRGFAQTSIYDFLYSNELIVGLSSINATHNKKPRLWNVFF